MIASPGCTAEPSTISSSTTVPKQAPETSTPRDHLAELSELATGDHKKGVRPLGEADADFRADRQVSAVDRDVVEHRQRLGPDADHVVDVHRHAVDPDRVEAPQVLGDQQLGANAVGRERDPVALVELDHAGVVAGSGTCREGRPSWIAPSALTRPATADRRPPGPPPPLRTRRRSRGRFFQPPGRSGAGSNITARPRRWRIEGRVPGAHKVPSSGSWVTRWLRAWPSNDRPLGVLTAWVRRASCRPLRSATSCGQPATSAARWSCAVIGQVFNRPLDHSS